MKNNIASIAIAVFVISCTKEAPTVAESTTSTSPTAAEIANAVPYPLDVCLVSGEELTSMGGPVTLIHEGRAIQFCCDACLPKFNENPKKYLSELDSKSKR